MIFETERVLVRKLTLGDLNAFHQMQSNPKVMQYVDKNLKNLDANTKELSKLIFKYTLPNNDFWIYAIERKSDSKFIGTLAFVEDVANKCEIGYRFLEEYWRNGYGNEVVTAMIIYCKTKGYRSLIVHVAYENIASDKIIKNTGFKYVEDAFCKAANVKERKYILNL
ncbi:hypothetical protein KCTC32516_01740 [Polaribacter huanghezhanensis]|uniref:GNAT family N-acetyltransferase n=1 Tax=Polaribacter huanghezhanensis TaxID=1354726 RepID=UPI00264A4C1D|nr:GNAT family N-acetyltransferase [Polaribacter huanghezhanensis]WKD86365.1 hypothetical protein KCTC32516_01740 [Polaribacter huanghezhanensis]